MNTLNIHAKKVTDTCYNITESKDNKLCKILFKTPIMKIPFGIEEYKGKLVANLEFTNKDTNKYMEEFFKDINKYDDFFNNIDNIDDLDLSNKQYCNFIKIKEKYDPLVRMSLKRSKYRTITDCYLKNITTNEQEKITTKEIRKNDKIQVIFCIDNLWIFGDKYGVSLVISKLFKIVG